jgi:signal transduction histidine kinase
MSAFVPTAAQPTAAQPTLAAAAVAQPAAAGPGRAASPASPVLADPAGAPARTRVLIARTAAVLRIVQLMPWPVAMALGARSGIERPELAAVSYGVQAAWSLAWTALVLRRRVIPRWSMLIDVPVAIGCLVAAGLACYPADVTGWANSAVAPAMGTAVAAAAAWPPAASAAAGMLLAAAYAAGVSRGLQHSPGTWAGMIGNICSLTGFGVLAGLLSHYLMRQAHAAAAGAAELAAARAAAAAEQSRHRERVRQYRMLHDTVLSTLSALARGGIDPADPAVRQRCAADADYLRGLISPAGQDDGTHLQGELAAVGRAHAPLGLRVHLHCADLPADLPRPVIEAVADAAREALNNVSRHAGTNQALITARGPGPARAEPSGPALPGPALASTDPAVVVTVTDRGCGFDPAAVPRGLGLRESIAARMREVGGTMHLDSSPGQGTTVELSWPA